MEIKPEICSLDMGSLNMGDRVFINTPTHLKAMALAIKDAGVTPELEVFETGHLLLAKRFLENGYVKGPGMFQICLGISWGQPATPEAMTYMRNLLPPGCTWFAFGISLWQFPMVAQAVLLGGHPRVGMEDNIYLEKGKLAPSNAALVEKAGKIIQIFGRRDRNARRRAGDAGRSAPTPETHHARRRWPGMMFDAIAERGRLISSAYLPPVCGVCTPCAPLSLCLQAGDARPGALVLVLHLDVQGAEPLGRQLDLVAVHERVEPAMVGAGRQDVARQQRVDRGRPIRCSAGSCAPCRRS